MIWLHLERTSLWTVKEENPKPLGSTSHSVTSLLIYRSQSGKLVDLEGLKLDTNVCFCLTIVSGVGQGYT